MLSRLPVFALLTDFGTRDHYVAAMKGLLLSACPTASIVDISHDVLPQCILEGAFLLASAYPYMPEGTIHIAVVDPGVGSARRGLIVSAGERYFVAPDNGILGYVLAENPGWTAYAIESPEFMLARVSATFHGRDVFAPAAVQIALGRSPSDAGPQITDPCVPEGLFAQVQGDDIIGRVIHVDRFGNLITNVPEGLLRSWLAGRDPAGAVLRAGAACAAGIRRYYAEVPTGETIALVGSSGRLELAVNGGSASERFGLDAGAAVTVTYPG
ncbi:MAG: SAM hydrolase/SAM-dependent halogenase family protein [Armatimonadota bacterium]